MAKTTVPLESLVGEIVCFAYQHEYRNVLVAEFKVTREGNTLLVGLDEDRNDFRSFRVDRIGRNSTIKKVK